MSHRAMGVEPCRGTPVICCDGTSNQFSSGQTSVLRLFEILEEDPDRQVSYYDPGVGTMPLPGFVSRVGKKLSELRGLAFGAGLTWKVQEAYTFLMNEWSAGDQVYLFGFSRGAYCVRVLAGFLYEFGLLTRGNENLFPYAMRLYRSIRGVESARRQRYWDECDAFRRTFARRVKEGDAERHFPVRFLGVWDTVSSVGWVWNPISFQHTHRNPGIQTVRHAVSVDERRCFFRQNSMVQAEGQDLQEYWFAGVHGDVGGSYPREMGRPPEITSHIWVAPFRWIVDGAREAGLRIDEGRLAAVLAEPPASSTPWNDPQRESLTGLWWVAEFIPKRVWQPEKRRLGWECGLGRRRRIPEGAWIAPSVLRRMRETSYAPQNLDGGFPAEVRALPAVTGAMQYKADGQAARPGERAG